MNVTPATNTANVKNNSVLKTSAAKSRKSCKTCKYGKQYGNDNIGYRVVCYNSKSKFHGYYMEETEKCDKWTEKKS